MSRIAVDTSVLLAIFKGEPEGKAWMACLKAASRTSALVISSVVWAEIRSFFPSDAACASALEALDITHCEINRQSANLAGKIFREYRDRGGPRTTILPDFLVAAHAAKQASALATEDRGYLRRYFPDVRILAPGAR